MKTLIIYLLGFLQCKLSINKYDGTIVYHKMDLRKYIEPRNIYLEIKNIKNAFDTTKFENLKVFSDPSVLKNVYCSSEYTPNELYHKEGVFQLTYEYYSEYGRYNGHLYLKMSSNKKNLSNLSNKKYLQLIKEEFLVFLPFCRRNLENIRTLMRQIKENENLNFKLYLNLREHIYDYLYLFVDELEDGSNDTNEKILKNFCIKANEMFVKRRKDNKKEICDPIFSNKLLKDIHISQILTDLKNLILNHHECYYEINNLFFLKNVVLKVQQCVVLDIKTHEEILVDVKVFNSKDKPLNSFKYFRILDKIYIPLSELSKDYGFTLFLITRLDDKRSYYIEKYILKGTK